MQYDSQPICQLVLAVGDRNSAVITREFINQADSVGQSGFFCLGGGCCRNIILITGSEWQQ